MQTLLTEVVNLRDTGCFMARTMVGQKPLDATLNGREYCTDDNQQGYDTSGTHLSAGGLRPFEVPGRGLGQAGERQRERALRQIGTDKFDGDGLGVEEVCSCCKNGFRLEERAGKWEKGTRTFEDDTKGAFADLPANAVVAADEVWRGGVVLGGHCGRGRGGWSR